eukprot:CAMPEP_0196593934 /NCGR_PEP_ID=MMETSP1081-20130531/76954_1 /TAXON_ID=36882 /ORGANISM="Pyramimonas amylifera, Strain CCMP720" /LENGTH=72 /DNA_ID=CAMNT_0041918061 /DNA_START=372 /DNA_END=590 /DNA_ORIENTATION=-
MTLGKDFYGPDGPYEAFAGKDATRALALMKVDEALTNVPNPTQGLSLSEMDILNDWFTKYENKYPKVGVLAS